MLAGQSVAPPPHAASRGVAPAGFDGFDAYVAGVMREWKVPGVAVGVIRDGKVVVAQVRLSRRRQKLPVTSQTLMAIGSNSKSFTVTLLGMLSDEGRLDWDKPVRTFLPDFELHDDVASRLMTPTDLVTHRSGLPRHDSLWYGRPFSRKELYQRLRYLELSATFRQRYQYNNLMFMTAGYLVEQLTKDSWDNQIKQRIFTPLGVTRSNTSVRDLPASGDHSLAYESRGTHERCPLPQHRRDRSSWRDRLVNRRHAPIHMDAHRSRHLRREDDHLEAIRHADAVAAFGTRSDCRSRCTQVHGKRTQRIRPWRRRWQLSRS
jgi:CubicO group peptidase (beta-lactamase class C family)